MPESQKCENTQEFDDLKRINAIVAIDRQISSEHMLMEDKRSIGRQMSNLDSESAMTAVSSISDRKEASLE